MPATCATAPNSKSNHLVNANYLYLIALSELYRSTPSKAKEWLAHYEHPAAAWEAIRHERKEQILDRAKREIEFVDRHQLQVFDYRSEEYPYRLRECADAPIILFGKGNLKPNQGKMVSIVGTRQATERGKEWTERLVKDLSRQVEDVTIISGLAYGIDIAAHRAAIQAGIPTIIIPAHGLDRIYPPLHRPVAVEALQLGGILTEYMSETEPERYNFVARNRIVAGMADAVVVAESKAKGGSLITAGLAVDYGRDVFACPGRPGDEQSQGCNELIRENKAGLIENADDLIRAMQWDSRPQTVQTELVGLWTELTPEQEQILSLLRQSEEGMHVNQLVNETGKSYQELSAELAMMEIDDLVKGLPGGIYRAIK